MPQLDNFTFEALCRWAREQRFGIDSIDAVARIAEFLESQDSEDFEYMLKNYNWRQIAELANVPL